MKERERILIAGAGPGGLCAALTLHRRGIPFLVLEGVGRDRLVADIGGGYDISVNVLRMLESLGIADGVRKVGRVMSAAVSMRQDGRVFDRIPMAADMDAAGVLRSRLQRLFMAELPDDAIRCDARVTGVDNFADHVEAQLQSGERVKGAVLIAADGVHSAVRAAMFDHGPPRYCGLTCVWGRTPLHVLDKATRESMPPPDIGLSVMGPGAIYLAGTPGDDWLWSAMWRTPSFVKSADRQQAKTRVAERFAGWAPFVCETIARTELKHIAEVAIWDRDPCETWCHGRTALIGDAAHPMTPFLGQGANSAMIDAFVLAHLLAEDEPTRAFELYEARRKRPVEKNVKTARFIANWMTTESGLAAAAFRAMLRVTPSSIVLRSITSADEVNDVRDLIGSPALLHAA